MPTLPQSGHPEQNPAWHANAGENQPEVTTPQKDDIHPQAPPEKQFGNHNDSQEVRPGTHEDECTHEDEWKPPSNR